MERCGRQVLVVEDDICARDLLTQLLIRAGYEVREASNGVEALHELVQQHYDLIITDYRMPGRINGLELMRLSRQVWPDTPVILVTAKDKDADKVRGLEMGADDYIVKPFSLDELGARIRAVLRRTTSADAERIVRARNIEIDLTRRLVKRDGELVSVTRTEWLLLQHLAANAGKVILNAELLSKVWGPEYRDDLQYLRVWVSRLRHKLEPEPGNPQIIKTLQGIGYMFDAEPAAVATP